MVKNEVKVKEKISLALRSLITDTIADGCFTYDESGEVKYVPYFKEMATVIAFATYILEGVEFDKDENIYETVMNDKELVVIYREWTHSGIYNMIKNDVDDIIEFKKQQLLRQNDTVAKYVTELLQLQIEVQKLQKQVLQQQEKIYSEYSKEDIDKLNATLEEMNKNFNSADYQKALADKVYKESKKKKPQDRKKPSKEV